MEPNDEEDDLTSDYAESIQSEFTSVETARLIQTHFEHGRRYQGILQGRYGLPNDENEQLREGIKHKLYIDYLFDGKHFLSPIGEYPQKIVDLGTGAGFWPTEVGEQYPSARVIGVDISPIQPQWTPPNVEFRVEDLEDENRGWTSIYAGADLIHVRALLQTIRDAPRLIQRSFDNIKPGGWIECHETVPMIFSDDGTADNHPMNRLYEYMRGEFTRIYGWNVEFPHRLPEALAEAGFVNVQQHRVAAPIGRWHSEPRQRELGLFCQSIIEDWVITLLSRPETLGMSNEEAEAFGQEMLDAFEDPSIHARITFLGCYAQKPY